MNKLIKKPDFQVNVVMTCVGSPMAPEIITALNKKSSFPIRVIGLDMDKNAVGQCFADKFYTVPSGRDPSYSDVVLGICLKEKVRVVIAGSDEEALNLAFQKDKFQEKGIVCVTPREEIAEVMLNKGAMYDFLDAKGVPLPKYKKVNHLDELKEAAQFLGYPHNDFCIKPLEARGGRGVWQVSPKGTMDTLLSGALNIDSITLNDLIKALSQSKNFPPLLAMEYINGDVFDVDLLANGDDVHYLIPRRRIHPRTVPFRGCRFEKNEAVLALSKKVQETLSLTYLFDFDIMTDEQGKVHLLEVNPRLSASVISSVAAGINLLEFVVRMALNREIPKVNIPYGKVIRPSYSTSCMNH